MTQPQTQNQPHKPLPVVVRAVLAATLLLLCAAAARTPHLLTGYDGSVAAFGDR